MNINFNFSNLASRYNLMSQLFGVKKNQGNGLLNPAGIFNARNQKGMGMANKSVKSDKEIEEIIYESGMCVRGMIMNGKSEAEMHQMIGVSEEYRQKMFDECKRHFLQENGVANGNTTKRSEVFRAYQLSVKEGDRLKGTWSLQQYEKQYSAALAAAVREANPNWKNGDLTCPRQHRHLKRKDSIRFLVLLVFSNFYIYMGCRKATRSRQPQPRKDLFKSG